MRHTIVLGLVFVAILVGVLAVSAGAGRRQNAGDAPTRSLLTQSILVVLVDTAADQPTSFMTTVRGLLATADLPSNLSFSVICPNGSVELARAVIPLSLQNNIRLVPVSGGSRGSFMMTLTALRTTYLNQRYVLIAPADCIAAQSWDASMVEMLAAADEIAPPGGANTLLTSTLSAELGPPTFDGVAAATAEEVILKQMDCIHPPSVPLPALCISTDFICGKGNALVHALGSFNAPRCAKRPAAAMTDPTLSLSQHLFTRNFSFYSPPAQLVASEACNSKQLLRLKRGLPKTRIRLPRPKKVKASAASVELLAPPPVVSAAAIDEPMSMVRRSLTRQFPRSDRPTSIYYEGDGDTLEATREEKTKGKSTAVFLDDDDSAGAPRTSRTYSIFLGVRARRGKPVSVSKRAAAGLSPLPSVEEAVSKCGSVEAASRLLG